MKANCIIITHPHSLSSPGGGTRSCLQISRSLSQLGIEVILIPVSSQADSSKPLDALQVISASPHPLHYLLTGLSIKRTVQDILKQKSVDAVIAWDYEAAFLSQLLTSAKIPFGMIAAKPSYSEWVNRKTGLPLLKRWTDGWFRWRPFTQADAVFVSSEFTRNELVDLFSVDPNKVVITRRGIDPLFFQAERQPLTKISNFIFYGSLAPIKGVFDAISALGLVAAQGHLDWKLKIAGWGDENALQQAIQNAQITENVQFIGRLEPSELVRQLEWAHLAILPSQAESFGRAIAEAQAAALPVISYSTGSIPEIIEDRTTGLLAPPKQIHLLADLMIQAMQHPAQTYAMGLAGRQRMRDRFSWEKTAKAILQGIEDARSR